MKKLRFLFPFGNRGLSHAVSAVITTATTIILVLVAYTFAYQVLEQQRAMAEFEVAKESILAFDDALENVAWKPDAVRSVRFTARYGGLQLVPNATTLIVNATVDGFTQTLYSEDTGFMKYSMGTEYVNFGAGYQSYILGDESLLVVNNMESYGRALIEQASDQVSITLNYRVQAMRTSVTVVDGTKVNYVEIRIIKVSIARWSYYVYDFDLKARCLDVTATSWGPYDVDEDDGCTTSVQFGTEGLPSSASISLEPGVVVFNVVVSEVQVGV